MCERFLTEHRISNIAFRMLFASRKKRGCSKYCVLLRFETVPRRRTPPKCARPRDRLAQAFERARPRGSRAVFYIDSMQAGGNPEKRFPSGLFSCAGGCNVKNQANCLRLKPESTIKNKDQSWEKHHTQNSAQFCWHPLPPLRRFSSIPAMANSRKTTQNRKEQNPCPRFMTSL